MNTFLTSFMGKLLGRSALYEQNNQETMTTERHIMSEHEFEQMVMRLRPRLMQMGRDFFGSDTEAAPCAAISVCPYSSGATDGAVSSFARAYI